MTLNISICAHDSIAAVSGPASWLQRVPPAFLDAGHNLTVHLFWWENEKDGVLRGFLEREGITFTSHKFSTTERNVQALLNAVAARPPHILIADNVIPALMAGRYLSTVGTQTIGIIRSDDAFYHAVIDTFAAGHAADRIRAFVAVSEFLGEEVRRRSRGECCCRVIPSGAPIPAEQAKWSETEFQIVYSGRLVEEQKRIIETTQCMIRLCRDNDKVRCVIIGDGPMKEEVEQLARASGMPISVVGRKSESEVQRILLQSQALLLLSDYEGTPTAVMEAMACGVVPVCLAIRSGIPELVIHEKTGLIVQHRDASCVSAFRSLTQSEDRWKQLSVSARGHVATGFSTQSCSQRWNALVSEISHGTPVKALKVPYRLRLPPTHQGFRHQDKREPAPLQKLVAASKQFLVRTRFHAGRLRRRILRQHIPPATTDAAE